MRNNEIGETMKLLRNRRFAVLLTAAVVLLSVLFGTGRSVRQLRNEAVTYFESGANGVNSVRKDLEASAAAVLNLCTVAERNLPADQDLAVLKGRFALASSPSVLPPDYDVYLSLYDTAMRLIGTLEKEALSEQDAKYVRGFRSELESRRFAIQQDPYNEMARAFNSTLRALPVRLLRPVLFVDDLDVYN